MLDVLGIATKGILTSASSGGGSSFNHVTNYNALPDPTTVSGQYYIVDNPQGAWYTFNYKPAGWYKSNGTIWTNIDADAAMTAISDGSTIAYADPVILAGSGGVSFTANPSTNTVTLNGTGSTTQYLRGDLSLASFPAIPTTTSQLTNNSGFITTESEPAFNASPAKSITSGEVTVLSNTSGTNTGDETTATIKSKLSISTLSGSNTGDQDLSALVPKTTTVNGHSLSSNISITSTDLSLNNLTNDAQLKRSANDFNSFTNKPTPVSGDVILIEDSTASGAKKYITVGSLPSGSLTYESSTGNIKKAGSVSVGVSSNIPRSDHVHPVNASTDLSDYSTGTWTPTDASGAGLSFSSTNNCWYIKLGRMVIASAYFNFPTTASGATIKLGGLPYAMATSPIAYYAMGAMNANVTGAFAYASPVGSYIYAGLGEGNLINSQMSGQLMCFTFTYYTNS